MTDVSRLDQELADALGLVQAVRAAGADARERTTAKKVLRALEEIDAELDGLQVELNEIVVADRRKRPRLTRRSRGVKEAEAGARAERLAEADALDALQSLTAETAYALAHWQVVRRLAKVDGDKRTRKLAAAGLEMSERHFATALRCCDRVAKREAKGVRGAIAEIG
jgi:hypothetical protein